MHELFFKNSSKEVVEQIEKQISLQKIQQIDAEKFLNNYKRNFENNLNMGVFNYPILMAADILAYDTDIVPVGQDQRQHLEMTRDIARAFNKTYKCEIFKVPSEYIEKDVAILPGLDGRKMSKSYNNFIGLFDDAKTLKKKVMSIVTDSK